MRRGGNESALHGDPMLGTCTCETESELTDASSFGEHFSMDQQPGGTVARARSMSRGKTHGGRSLEDGRHARPMSARTEGGSSCRAPGRSKDVEAKTLTEIERCCCRVKGVLGPLDNSIFAGDACNLTSDGTRRMKRTRTASLRRAVQGAQMVRTISAAGAARPKQERHAADVSETVDRQDIGGANITDFRRMKTADM
ncbi:hypothetical protein BD311DRAFT_270091 [Dichomitus squalens]|uniref:Uncharacterized protein n=1 Tax=Dichomitus squalens TaxID=114155 RepID=A0A4Q9MNV0_9APHY|nr:hypothetical protein BD311DRAFT_270091 [Dichomitus squalens]